MAKKLKAVDLFCGAGGTTSGIVQACNDIGIDVDLVAINHWNVAIDTHSRNYPKAKHLCTSLDNLNPREVVPGGHLNLLVASPECTHHSIARGGRPVNEQNRASAWCILRWAEALYIENILVENVREFMDWGPVGKNGQPIKRLKGELFLQFVQNLKALDYRVDFRVLNAADYGDPTTRERLFVMARRKRKAISWPTPTHSRTGQATADMFGQTLKPWVPAKQIIDWTLAGQNIFTRKKPLADNTLRRIFAGLEKFGGEAAQPFLVILRGTGGSRSIELPVPAITAQGKHIALAEPSFMLGQQSKSAPRSTNDPVPTVCGKGAIGFVQSFMVDIDHTGSNGKCIRSTDEPVSTITSKHRAVCEPYIVAAGGPEGQGRTPKSVEQPMGTILTENHQALVEASLEPFIVPQFSDQGPRSIEEPLGTLTTTSRGVRLIEPYVVSVNHGNGDQGEAGHVRRVHDLESPLPAVTTKNGYGIAEAQVVPVECEFCFEKPCKCPDPFLTKYYATAKTAQSVEEPLDTVTTKERFALVQPIVNGMKLEIRFRMLQPHELAAAQSFPKDYKFAGNKSEVTKQIGNAVCVNLAKALITALLK